MLALLYTKTTAAADFFFKKADGMGTSEQGKVAETKEHHFFYALEFP